MADREEHQQPAVDRKPKKGTKKKAVTSKKVTEAASTPPPTEQRRPAAKLTFKQKQATDYIRTATRNNVWYYRDRWGGSQFCLLVQSCPKEECQWRSLLNLTDTCCALQDECCARTLHASCIEGVLVNLSFGISQTRHALYRIACKVLCLALHYRVHGIIAEDTLVWGHVRQPCLLLLSLCLCLPDQPQTSLQIFNPLHCSSEAMHSCFILFRSTAFHFNATTYEHMPVAGVQGLVDFLPIKNVRTLVPQIRTLEGVSTGFLSCTEAHQLQIMTVSIVMQPACLTAL